MKKKLGLLAAATALTVGGAVGIGATPVLAANPTGCSWAIKNWTDDVFASVCSSMNGGAQRAKVVCSNGTYYGNKVYSAGTWSVVECPGTGQASSASIVLYAS